MAELPARARRSLLIALNTCLDFDRATVCRLAQNLGAWLEPDRGDAATAASLEISRPHLLTARSIRRRGDETAARELERADRAGFRIVTIADRDYPRRLFDLDLPPPVLYLSGSLDAQLPAVAIVGSRNATAYGIEVTDVFAGFLGSAGVAVISGFARGVDERAHRSAVARGVTVAVLGCGLDVDYPRGRRALRQRLRERGALVSELPLGTQPLPRNFPVRNRIIAALADVCLVVEATPRSGSLSTARHAVDLGRSIAAIPGPIFASRSHGPNALIRDGAVPALHPQDLIDCLPLQARDRLSAPADGEEALSAAAERTLAVLEVGAADGLEEIARRVGRSVSATLQALAELELAGRAQRLPGGRYMARSGGRTERLFSR